MGRNEYVQTVQNSIDELSTNIENADTSQLMPQFNPSEISAAAAQILNNKGIPGYQNHSKKGTFPNLLNKMNTTFNKNSKIIDQKKFKRPQLFKIPICNRATRIYNPDTYFGKMDPYSIKRHNLKYCKGFVPKTDYFEEIYAGNLNSEKIKKTNKSIENIIENSKEKNTDKDTIRVRFKNTKNYLYFNILVFCTLLVFCILFGVLLRKLWLKQ